MITSLFFFLFFSLQVSKQKSAHMGMLKNKEIRMALMMFTTITIFFVCNSFQSIYFLRWSYRDKNDKEYHELGILKPYWHISHFLMVFNCSIASIISAIFCKKFRKLFLKKFCCKHEETPLSNTNYNLKVLNSFNVPKASESSNP